MATGTVKWFRQSLAEGAQVRFDAVDGANGPEAESVVAV